MKSRIEKSGYAGIVALCFFTVIATMVIYPLVADEPIMFQGFKLDKQIIGLQYRFNDGWADQFSGKIYPVNQSAFIIEWYRYSIAEPARNQTFYKPNASSYTIEILINVSNDTAKTIGSFYVEWFDANGINIGYSVDSGELFIRDLEGSRRLASEILKIRKYTYSVGDFEY